MRRLLFGVLLAVMVACEPAAVMRTPVVWMDWPAQVIAERQFAVRLVVPRPCARLESFNPSPHADTSAVTFAPYFLADRDGMGCVTAQSVDVLVDLNNLDTTGLAPGLASDFARTYQMRGATQPSGTWSELYWTARAFGDVVVYPAVPPPSAPIRNAAGWVQLQVDTAGCARIRPAGLYGRGALMVLEDQADTVGLSGAFVRGYLHYPAAPVCGEAQAFHLVTRE